MEITPGIHTIHRASDATVQPMTLEHDAAGLRVIVGPVAPRSQSGCPAITLVLTGGIETDGLGAFGVGEMLVTDAADELRPTAPDTNVMTVIYEHGSSPEPKVALRPREQGELPPTPRPQPLETLLTDPPTQRALIPYRDPSDKLTAGFWDSTAYARRSTVFPNTEFFHLVSGSIALQVDDGPDHHFSAGDTYMIATGTACDWRTPGMAKVACTYHPAR